MTNDQTLEKMHSMKLYGMAQAYKSTIETGLQKDFSTEELIAHLIDAEWDDKYNRKIQRLIKAAKFRYKASVEKINFTIPRKLDKNLILKLSDCNWINKKKNILITGCTGSGKSWISCALGNQACVYGFRTLYFRSVKLFPLLKLSRVDGTLINKIEKIQKQDLFILDDFGLDHLDKDTRLLLLEILEDRFDVHSTIITSQLPVENWHEVIGDSTIGDAIVDRLIHNSIIIKIDAKKSMRGENAK